MTMAQLRGLVKRTYNAVDKAEKEKASDDVFNVLMQHHLAACVALEDAVIEKMGAEK